MKPKIITLEEKIELANERHGQMLDAVVQFPSVSDLPESVKDQMASMVRTTTEKSKVLVLYYGGTLGMEYKQMKGAQILVPSEGGERLLSPLKERGLYERMDLVWFPVLGEPIDSTNGRWPHWVSIANAIELLYDDFDGFVVAGGTDTMDYLMAAMHFIFPNIGKPIIGAAAQQPIGEWGDDAIRNLAFSLQAATEDLSGAHLAFYDVLRHGRHIFKVKDRGYDAFSSPDIYRIGMHEQGNVILFGNHPIRYKAITKKNLKVEKNFRDGIQMIQINPYQWADSLLYASGDPNTHVILLTTYGAGNARDLKMFKDDDKTHIEVLKTLHEQKYPVVLGSQMEDGIVDSPYESGTKALLAGAISGGNTTGSTLVVKISRALHNSWDTKSGVNYSKFRKEMYRNHIGELNENIKDRMLIKG